MVALKWSMKAIYDIDPGETFWAASDVGWVVGHSYIVYAPLLHGCASVLYEGKPVGTPDAGAFWRVISEHERRGALHRADRLPRHPPRRSRKAPSSSKYDLSKFRTLFLAGERADTATIEWAEHHLGRPGHRSLVADGDRLVDLRQPGRARAAAGQIRLARRADAGLRPAGARRRGAPRSPAGTLGNIVVKLPLPPSALPTLWNADQRFRDSYLAEFPGYYKTADAGYRRRRRLRLRHGAHRRHHQRRRPPAFDRRDGGGARRPSRRRRMRGDRRRRSAQGPGAVRLRRAEGGRRRATAPSCRRECVALRARGDRPGRRLPRRCTS